MPARHPPDGIVGIPAARWYFKAVVSDAKYYLASNTLVAAATFGALPLILRALSHDEIAQFALIESSLILLCVASLLGLKFAFMQWASERAHPSWPALFSAATLPVVVLAAVLSVGLAAVLGTAPVQGLAGGPVAVGLPDILAFTLPFVLREMLIARVRMGRRPRRILIAGVVQTVITIAATWLLLMHGHWGVRGAVLGMACGLGASLPVLAVGERLFGPVPWVEIPSMLRYGVPMMVANFVRFALEGASRFLLSTVSAEAVAIYLVAAKLAEIFENVIAISFAQSWGALIYDVARRPDATLIAARMVVVVWNGALALGAALILGTPGLASGFGSTAPEECRTVLIWLLLGKAIQMATSPATIGLLATRRMVWQIWMSLLSVVIFAGAVLLLGAAPQPAWMAGLLVASLAIAAGVTIHYSARRIPLNLGLGGMGRLGVPAVPLIMAAMASQTLGGETMVLSAGILAAYGVWHELGPARAQ